MNTAANLSSQRSKLIDVAIFDFYRDPIGLYAAGNMSLVDNPVHYWAQNFLLALLANYLMQTSPDFPTKTVDVRRLKTIADNILAQYKILPSYLPHPQMAAVYTCPFSSASNIHHDTISKTVKFTLVSDPFSSNKPNSVPPIVFSFSVPESWFSQNS